MVKELLKRWKGPDRLISAGSKSDRSVVEVVILELGGVGYLCHSAVENQVLPIPRVQNYQCTSPSRLPRQVRVTFVLKLNYMMGGGSIMTTAVH